MTETRIIFTHGGGRLANQLISHAHLLAFCAEHTGRFSLCNTAMWPWRAQFFHNPVYPRNARPPAMARLCEALLKTISGKPRHNSFLRLVYGFAGILPGVARTRTQDVSGRFWVPAESTAPIDLMSADTSILLGRRPVQLLCGWRIRSWALVKPHRAMVLEHTRPCAEIAASAERLVAKLRARFDFLVGVHIRRGDYRDYQGGRFFYGFEEYANWMRQIRQRYADRGRVGFLICSDEQFTLHPFQDLNATAAWDFEEALPLRDNAALARCDILVAPPSTFALWAAFSGGIPMLVIVDASADLRRQPILQDSFFDWLHHPLFTEFAP